MHISAERAKEWAAFLIEKAAFPCPERLQQQFEAAQFTSSCECHCNSFDVLVDRQKAPDRLFPHIAQDGHGHNAIFAVDFTVEPGRDVEVIIFADDNGYITELEISYCANSYPVPEDLNRLGAARIRHCYDDLCK